MFPKPKNKERERQYDTLSADQSHFPLFKTSAVGLVQGHQTVARGELTALLVLFKIAIEHPIKADGKPDAIFVTDASYVRNVIALICSGDFHKLSHKLPNSDIILELAGLSIPTDFSFKRSKVTEAFPVRKIGETCGIFLATFVQIMPQQLRYRLFHMRSEIWRIV